MQILQRIQEYDALIEQSFRDQQHSMGQGALNLVQLQNFPNYIWRLKQNRFYEFQALQAQERVIQAIRGELQQALIKKKSLEVLKEKDYTQYRKKLEKAEEEFLAEIALSRSIRQKVSV